MYFCTGFPISAQGSYLCSGYPIPLRRVFYLCAEFPIPLHPLHTLLLEFFMCPGFLPLAQHTGIHLCSTRYRTILSTSLAKELSIYPAFKKKQVETKFYVTEGNIMYFTDGFWFLISCVIQHYAPVVGWGWGEEQVHNVDYDPSPVMTLLCHCFNLLSRGNKYGISFPVSIYGPLSYGPSTLPLRHCCNVSIDELRIFKSFNSENQKKPNRFNVEMYTPDTCFAQPSFLT